MHELIGSASDDVGICIYMYSQKIKSCSIEVNQRPDQNEYEFLHLIYLHNMIFF